MAVVVGSGGGVLVGQRGGVLVRAARPAVALVLGAARVRVPVCTQLWTVGLLPERVGDQRPAARPLLQARRSVHAANTDCH